MKIESSTANTTLPAIRKVKTLAPLEWLALAWQSLSATRFIGMIYGAIFVTMGFTIVIVYATQWQLTMGLIAGFLLVGPFLATGIYDISRQQEANDRVSLLQTFFCWRRNPGAIALFAVILTFCMIVWARVSVIVFALTSNISFPSLKGVVGAIFSLNNFPFILLWTAVGLVFATIVFAISVVSIPMLLDRSTDTISAVLTSVRVLILNPKAMMLWAFLIATIIGLSLLAGLLGLLVTAPLIGHATWHAYRAMVSHEYDQSPN